MELKITVTRKNKERILQLLSEMVDADEGGADEESNTLKVECSKSSPKRRHTSEPNEAVPIGETTLLAIPPSLQNLSRGTIFRPRGDARTQHIGPWIQFNSFFPVKAGIRILANSIREKNPSEIEMNLAELVKTCKKVFDAKNFKDLRGFPSSDKESAIGRFVWHFLATALEMGLITITRHELDEKAAEQGIPLSRYDWDTVWIAPTQEGLEFARINNRVFDGTGEINKTDQVATLEEKEWWLRYLRHLDEQGYRFYTMLLTCYNYLKEGHDGKEELPKMLKDRASVVRFVESSVTDNTKWDRVKKEYANSLASSYVAMLRELGLVNPKRGVYDIIGEP